jgi:2-octaprenyl-6-methoxyphenol hydroxylase
LRDAAYAAEIVGDAMAAGEDPGSQSVLAEYQSTRRFDVVSRQLVVDTTNRSLLSGIELFGIARSFGLKAIGALPGFRRQVMRTGLGQSSSLPRVMLG